MKIWLKFSAVVFTMSLAACQTTSPLQKSPPPVDPAPPTVNSQKSQQTGSMPAPRVQQPAQSQSQGRSNAVITLHLAQQKQEPSLLEVNVGGPAPLYALPNPMLTQTDMARVMPVNTPEGTFLMLEMNERGIAKLKSITEQARGHYFLLSVQGQLVSVTQIGEVITDGRLLVPTQNQQHTQAIIRLMQGAR